MKVMTTIDSTASGCAQVKTNSAWWAGKKGNRRWNACSGAATEGIKNPQKRRSPAAIEATDAGRPTIECIQPNRNPQTGPKPRRRYAYSPPASGIIDPNSANENEPKMEQTAA